MSPQIYLLLTGYHIVFWTINAFEIQFERGCHRSCHMDILCYALDNRIASSFLCTQVTQVLPLLLPHTHTPTTLRFSPLIRFDSIRFDSFVLFACNRRVPLVVLSPSTPPPPPTLLTALLLNSFLPQLGEGGDITYICGRGQCLQVNAGYYRSNTKHK